MSKKIWYIYYLLIISYDISKYILSGYWRRYAFEWSNIQLKVWMIFSYVSSRSGQSSVLKRVILQKNIYEMKRLYFKSPIVYYFEFHYYKDKFFDEMNRYRNIFLKKISNFLVKLFLFVHNNPEPDIELRIKSVRAWKLDQTLWHNNTYLVHLVVRSASINVRWDQITKKRPKIVVILFGHDQFEKFNNR